MDFVAFFPGCGQDLAAQVNAEHHTDAPVDPIGDAGNEQNQHNGGKRGIGHISQAMQGTLDRRRSGDHRTGDHNQGHLHGEGQQVPEALHPGVHQAELTFGGGKQQWRWGKEQSQNADDDCQQKGKYHRIRRPFFKKTDKTGGQAVFHCSIC